VKSLENIHSIVDLGGGGIDSEFAQLMSARADSYVVVDAMGENRSHGKMRQVIWDMENGLQGIFPDNSIDVFITASTIEHMSAIGQKRIFEEVERALRPGGIFCGTISYFTCLTPAVLELVKSDPVFLQVGSPIYSTFNACECTKDLRSLKVPFPPVSWELFPGFDGFNERKLLDNSALLFNYVGSYGNVKVKPEIDALKMKWFEMGFFLVKDS